MDHSPVSSDPQLAPGEFRGRRRIPGALGSRTKSRSRGGASKRPGRHRCGPATGADRCGRLGLHRARGPGGFLAESIHRGSDGWPKAGGERSPKAFSGRAAVSSTGAMTRFQVWAPHARTVEVRVGARSYPMKAGGHQPPGGGWLSGDVADAHPGDDYVFVLDGDALPDPRSPWQPDGVHGASRLLDHSAFSWTDGAWQAPPLASAIVYEL